MSKPVYTVRCTNIEAFRQWMDANEEDTPWHCEANVIESIKGIESYSIKADYGTAGHSLIEDAPRYLKNNIYKVGAFSFTQRQVEPLLKFRREHPLMTREIVVAKIYETPQFFLIITGHIDHLEGIIARDTKFKFSNFHVEDFLASFQWKCYLDMIGLDHFIYDFFPVKNFEQMEDVPNSVIGELESMPVRRYDGMERDIQHTINQFAEFVTFKGLTKYLEITPTKARKILAGNSSLKQYLP